MLHKKPLVGLIALLTLTVIVAACGPGLSPAPMLATAEGAEAPADPLPAENIPEAVSSVVAVGDSLADQKCGVEPAEGTAAWCKWAVCWLDTNFPLGLPIAADPDWDQIMRNSWNRAFGFLVGLNTRCGFELTFVGGRYNWSPRSSEPATFTPVPPTVTPAPITPVPGTAAPAVTPTLVSREARCKDQKSLWKWLLGVAESSGFIGRIVVDPAHWALWKPFESRGDPRSFQKFLDDSRDCVDQGLLIQEQGLTIEIKVDVP